MDAKLKNESREAQESVPAHVAVIPDGNRRWARERGEEPWRGHEAGAENSQKIIERAHRLGVKHLSFWGSSRDNLDKRPLEEKRALLRIYQEYFRRLVDDKHVHENGARISIIGKWREQFPGMLTDLLNECEERTSGYSSCFLNFFLAYNGDDEMVEAVRGIVRDGIAADDIDGDAIKGHLLTRDLPPVDLLIRTGGEPHLSAGFMMWDLANAQLYFTDRYYPDFGAEQFEEAIRDFQQRGRRLGR